MMDNETKTKIITRLHNKAGIYSGGMQILPDTLNTRDVLEAINLDEFFFKESITDGSEPRK